MGSRIPNLLVVGHQSLLDRWVSEIIVSAIMHRQIT